MLGTQKKYPYPLFQFSTVYFCSMKSKASAGGDSMSGGFFFTLMSGIFTGMTQRLGITGTVDSCANMWPLHVLWAFLQLGSLTRWFRAPKASIPANKVGTAWPFVNQPRMSHSIIASAILPWLSSSKVHLVGFFLFSSSEIL